LTYPSDQGSARLSRPVEISLVLVILLGAGLLRMGAPGMTEFKADEARLLSLALDMAQGQGPALRGISSSVGLPNFPASVWLYALPVALWPHPYAATLFTGLLATLAVAACYWFVRRYWGITAALMATLLYAASPWAVIFARKIWAQDLLPLFVMGWVIGAALAFVEERPRYLWLHFICLALAVQIHLAAAALVPATLLLLLFFRQRVRPHDVVIGGGLAALTAVPFLLYLWQTRDQLALPGAVSGGSGSGLSLQSVSDSLTISLGLGIHSLTGGKAYEAYLATMPDLTAVHIVLALLILGGSVLLAWRVWKQREQPAAQAGLIVLVWMLMPALFFLWHSTPVFLHYFIAVLPAPFIAAGIGLAALPGAVERARPGSRRIAPLASWALAGLIVLAQVYALLSLFSFLARTATPGGFGVPLGLKLETADRARALMAQSSAAEILLAGEGEAPLVDEFPAEWAVLLRGTPHRFVDANRSALFPAQTAVVLLDSREPTPTWTGDLYQAAASSRQEIPLRAGEGSYLVLELPGSARPTPSIAFEPPYLLANWINLLGADAPQRLDEDTAVWQIHWRTGDNPDPATYHFFNHLQESSGQRLGQADEPAFSPSQWRAGDSLISRFLLPWPEMAVGPLTMRVGMYRYPSLDNVPLLDVAGNPYLDAAEIPLDNQP
jgi:4-amino-4-deoxy-L-arabinose transferase-like glycosyltransferase